MADFDKESADYKRGYADAVKSLTGSGDAKGVYCAYEKLWGKHGGELELVKISFFRMPGRNEIFAQMLFTDHDVLACKDAPVDEIFYKLNIVVADDVEVASE